ncbi:helix-turn-helix domain-containing protein [Mesorhizobium sp. CGMCC 1.15528]|uniref:Helix-turn-helix domain-containing protein n=1 Tax=Mesorhizobium zhangyense TaxID=1776730 RepID=A0A7C9RAD5_9HYPH|nr:helix-turn-helix domain-containing protein [Mesorhizobium zhangyense]NGN44022.1 helix-turn-helix domain-containing protein [Mesorhizobium zhangyense]
MENFASALRGFSTHADCERCTYCRILSPPRLRPMFPDCFLYKNFYVNKICAIPVADCDCLTEEEMDASARMGELGAALRRLRKTANLTMEAAARQADVTKGYLSKVESGASQPSIAVVSRLADVYGVPLSEVFISPGEKGPISIVRADERRLINRNGSELGYVYEIASFNKANPRSEIFFLTLPCIEDAHLPNFRHAGEEVLLVLEGRIRFDYAGTEIILGPGDCIQFEASFDHNGVAIDGKEAKAFVVITPDKKL